MAYINLPSISNYDIHHLTLTTPSSSIIGNLSSFSMIPLTGSLAGYTQTNILNQNSSTNYNEFFSSWMIDSSSNIKPNIGITAQLSNTQRAFFSINNASATTNNIGLFSSHFNDSAGNGTFGAQEFYPDAFGNAHGSLYLGTEPGPTANTGFQLLWNSRPNLLGDLNVLTTSSNSVTCFNDFLSDLNNPGYIKLPGGLQISWGEFFLTTSGELVTYDIPFPHDTFSVVATARDTTGSTILTIFNTSSTGFHVYYTPAGTTTCFYIAIGF